MNPRMPDAGSVRRKPGPQTLRAQGQAAIPVRGLPERRGMRPLERTFWIVAAALGVYFLVAASTAPLPRAAAAAAILLAVAFPAYLWTAGHVRGFPVFPLHALTFLWTYANPLVTDHPDLTSHSDIDVVMAGLAVAAYLLLGTVAWVFADRKVRDRATWIRVLSPNKGRLVFPLVLVLSGLFTASVVGGWPLAAGGVVSILRAILFALAAVGIFALAYRWGRRELGPAEVRAFVASFAFYGLTQLSSLYLVSGMIAVVSMIAGFTIGRGRLPLLPTIAAAVLFAFLHAGKGDMREDYWYPVPVEVQFWDYPALFAKWLERGAEAMRRPDAFAQGQPLSERLSLAHLLVRVMDESPESIPYLGGETYRIIPELLVPRIFLPGKVEAHEGTAILSIHYGLQTREDTRTTTIGWGLQNEAYANFGFAGLAVLAIIMGGALGVVGRRAAGVPTLSLRMMTALTFAAFAVQTEFTAGVFVSALFQSLVAVALLGVVMMDRRGHAPLRP